VRRSGDPDRGRPALRFGDLGHPRREPLPEQLAPGQVPEGHDQHGAATVARDERLAVERARGSRSVGGAGGLAGVFQNGLMDAGVARRDIGAFAIETTCATPWIALRRSRRHAPEARGLEDVARSVEQHDDEVLAAEDPSRDRRAAFVVAFWQQPLDRGIDLRRSWSVRRSTMPAGRRASARGSRRGRRSDEGDEVTGAGTARASAYRPR
jgi:hypothetical protein